MRAPQQVRVTCTPANKFAVFIKIVWCRCVASAAIQLRKLVVRSTKSPAGAVQSAQWRELDSSSSRATAESPAVMRCACRLSHLWCSSLSGGTADGKKDMRASRPQTPRQVRITCTSANRVCRLYKNSMVQVRCICRSPAAQAGRRRRNPPPERSNPLSGENLIYQVRELRRNPLRSCAVSVGSRSFASRPLAVGTADGKKDMRASRPQTPRQVRITCTSANRVCRLYKNSMVQVRCICRSPAAQAGRRRRNPPPERSNLLNGENLIYQVRELRRNPLWSCAVPVGSRSFASRPLAVEPPTWERT